MIDDPRTSIGHNDFSVGMGQNQKFPRERRGNQIDRFLYCHVASLLFMVAEGMLGADGLVEIFARHPNIRYQGRVDCNNADGPAFAWPGASIRVRFKSDALDMRLRDHGTGMETSTNYYNIVVDGNITVLEVWPSNATFSSQSLTFANTQNIGLLGDLTKDRKPDLLLLSGPSLLLTNQE